MSTGKELARELAQEILKPHWPVVHNMEENEARQKEVERIESALARYGAQQRVEEARDWNEMLKLQDLRAADEIWRKNRMYAREREAESLGASSAAKG